ncbi:MAG TPA: CRISPR-associated protein Csx15 [Blastocatellia bacterium]|nr:CRISPR-associated protein Csx15 [Blastocatellia bacterium]
MLIINFSHPLAPAQIEEVERMAGQQVERVIEVDTQLDHEKPFAEQLRALMRSIDLSSSQWQSLPFIINLPSFSVIAALVLAELHGLTGYFPSVLRSRRIEGAATSQFEVAEILNLQMARDAARAKR